jgi:hypothetical protein
MRREEVFFPTAGKDGLEISGISNPQDCSDADHNVPFPWRASGAVRGEQK